MHLKPFIFTFLLSVVGHLKNKDKEKYFGGWAGKSRCCKFLTYKAEVISNPSIIYLHFSHFRKEYYMCLCARMHVYVLLFVYTNQSKRIDSRKWSMMGNIFFYFKKQTDELFS